MKFTVSIPRAKRRATELYEKDSPFKPKSVPTKREKLLHKKTKHKNRCDDES